MESKLLTNGWKDESSPAVHLMPVNLAPSKPDSCRRLDGSSAPGADAAVAPRERSASPLTVAGVKITLPGWLSTWWKDFTSDKALMVEVISRAVFPLLFCIFNLVYWPWYLL